MNKNQTILLIFLTLATTLTTNVVAYQDGNAGKEVRKPPNIVLIFADDMAWADVGYNGQKDFETPHIDQMAADGIRFDAAYSGASICSPSRACLLTGMYLSLIHISEPTRPY